MSFWDSYNAAYNAGTKRYSDFQAAQDRGAQRKAGNALAGGDYTGAQNVLNRNGMLGEAHQVGQYQQQQADIQQANQDRDRKQHAEVVLKATDAIRRYGQMKPGANPLEAFDAVAPLLQQVTDPQALAHIREQFARDPMAVLAMAEQEAKKALQVVNVGDGAIAAFDPNQTDPRKALTMLREPTPKPVGGKWMERSSGPNGETALQWVPDSPDFNGGGQPQTAGPGGFAGPTSGAAPRSQRNNNPGNIEDGAFAKSLPGYQGSDGRFAIFDTPESGGLAAVKLVQSYGQRGFNTVSKIINRWAPSSDNNPTPAYIAHVAKTLGVSPEQPLDLSNPQVAVSVVKAIAQFEAGTQTASNGPAQQARGGSIPWDAAKPDKTGKKDGMYLRKEFNALPEVKQFQTVATQYDVVRRLASATPTAPNDVSMIFAYMKILDPTSVVREGEFATAQATTGIPGRVVNAYNKARDGERLNPQQRREFTEAAERIYAANRDRYDQLVTQYQGYAGEIGLESSIIQPRPAPPPLAPARGGGGQGGKPAPAPQNAAQRQKGATYSTPKGPLKWTGTGWVQP